jgi:hypothetical protein
MSAKERGMPRELNRRGLTVTIILLVKIVGVVGFVSLLVASHYFPAFENVCRGLALLWFAAFGVVYVLLSSRVRVRGLRWP